jgi:cyanophycinase-like exopeptidase
MTASAPGLVYLAASSQGDAIGSMIKRAIDSAPMRAGKRKPRVAISYAAVADSLAGRTFMKSFATKMFWGAELVAFHVAGEKSKMDSAKAKTIVEEADIVFLTGGDPVLGARLLVDAGADGWLRDARARGAACIGISAGSIMLGAVWAEWPEEPPPGAKWDGGKLVRCTGVVKDMVLDCHAEEDDWSELKLVSGLLEDQRASAGPRAAKLPRRLGLPTASGIIVDGKGGIEWVGAKPFALG